MPSDDLAELRAELGQVDEAIRRSIAERLAIARRIGRAKRRAGLPIRVASVERAVVARWQDGLERLKIPPERAELLARWLVEEATRIQEDEGPRREVAPRNVLIVGGAGAIGRWLSHYARVMGHRVRVVDPRRDPKGTSGAPRRITLAKGAEWADLIAVAVPIDVAPGVYDELARLGARGVVFDLLSVKAPLRPAIRRARTRGLRVTSVHPLFGPNVRPLAGHTVLVLDCGDPDANESAVELFRPSSLRVTVLPITVHDRWMSDLQALPRIVSLLFTEALSQSPAAPAELAGAETPSFRRQSSAARAVAHENPELSFGLVHLNPHTKEVLRRVAKALERLRSAVDRSDRREHARLLERAGHALAGRRGPGRRTRGSSAGTRPARRS